MTTNLLGGINIANQKPAQNMTQKGQSAWDAIFPVTEKGEYTPKILTGAGYVPLVYAGDQMVSGGAIRHNYIALQTVIYSTTIKHIVKLGILEFNNEYRLIPESIEVIY